jgi:hypothetical protein
MIIARQRFGNTRSRGNEQKRKSIASQRLAKHTPAVTDKIVIHELLEMVIYIRSARKLVQFS